MPPQFRELRYVRRHVGDLEQACRFAEEVFGLKPEDQTETEAIFRSDTRFYSLCLSTDLPDAVAFRVDQDTMLDDFAEHCAGAGFETHDIIGDAAERRMIKRGIAVTAPNGTILEIVWRHLESGWPYHDSRDTGLTGFSAVQLGSTDVAADADFWQRAAGLNVADYAGDARYLTLGQSHHQIALYPSGHDGLLGAVWQVKSLDHVMRHWHFLRDHQVPVIHGPGRQPTSEAVFVTAQAPDNFLMTYATEMTAPPETGPRQFRAEPRSHCSWGSHSDRGEFRGERT